MMTSDREKALRQAAHCARTAELAIEALINDAEEAEDTPLAEDLLELLASIGEVRQCWECDRGIAAVNDLDRAETGEP